MSDDAADFRLVTGWSGNGYRPSGSPDSERPVPETSESAVMPGMRIVIDMQPLQETGVSGSVSRRSLDHVRRMMMDAQGRHEIMVVLSDLYPQTIDALRSALEGVLRPEQISVWHVPSDGRQPWSAAVERHIREHLLASLRPDIIHLAGDAGSLAAQDLFRPGKALVNVPVSVERHCQPDSDAAISSARIAELTIDLSGDDFPDSLKLFEAWFDARPASGSPGKERRRLLACVSPLPPEPSGISSYTAELLPWLAGYYDIEVIVDQQQVDDPWIIAHCPVRSIAWFRENHYRYDRVLYHFGNSPFHRHMFSLLEQVPGTVVMHEIYLSDIVGYLDRHGESPGYFLRELYQAHDYRPVRRLMKGAARDEIVREYPCSYSVFRNAEGVIVHSAHAKAMACRWYGSEAGALTEVIPHLRVPAGAVRRQEARRALALRDDQFVVCSFGHIGEFKLNSRLLDAWCASELHRNPSCLLVFVGKNDTGRYGRILQDSIDSRSGITITGWVDEAGYRRWLEAADLAVQLRSESRGESSGAVLDCMNYGLPVIVNAHGSMAEFEKDTLCMIQERFSDRELCRALERLYGESDTRRSFGVRAQTYIRRAHDPKVVAARYAEAIERFAAEPLHCRTEAIRCIAAEPLFPSGDRESLRSIAEVLAATFPSPLRRKQLLVDISALAQTDLGTGIQRVVRSIVRNFIDHPPSGCRVEPVYATHDQPYRYACKRTLELLGCTGATMLPDELAEFHPGDLLFIPDLHFQVVKNNRTLYTAMRRNGARVVFLVHDLLPVRFPGYFPGKAFDEFTAYLEVISGTADAVIGVTAAVADDLREWISGYRLHRQSPIAIGWNHHGADIDASIPTSGLPPGFETALHKLSMGQTVLMVGTVEPRKGYAQALQAMELLWAEGRSCNLVIVGKAGWMIDELQKRLEHHRESGRRLFWFRGISDEALLRLYAQADGVLMASEGEGFGLPLIEAARQGLPVLARDISVFREIAGDHVSYFSDVTAAGLALCLTRWIDEVQQGRAPDSRSIPWCTWAESTRRLADMLSDPAHPNWLYRM